MLCNDKLPQHTTHHMQLTMRGASNHRYRDTCRVQKNSYIRASSSLFISLLLTCPPPYESEKLILHRWGPFNMTWLRFFDSLPHR